MITIEDVLDKISNEIIKNVNEITSELGYNVVKASQKVIRGGEIKVAGQSEIQPGERLVLFDQDILANSEDDLELLEESLITEYGSSWYDETMENIIVDVVDTEGNDSFGGWQIYLGTTLITDIIVNLGEDNPLNVGQFIDFDESKISINPDQAKEFLDTNIFELLPTGETKQERINKFFQEYQALKGEIPSFDTDGDGIIDTTFDSTAYAESHDISAAQDTPDIGISEEDAFITRLNTDANTQNASKTLQYLRDDLNNFLKDVDAEIDSELEEGRPEYESKSEGYLKIRNLNQGIIIRKQEGDDIGIEKIVTSGVCSDLEGPSYLCDGFTITMWTRFLDKTSKGTLFNYGNPMRGVDPKGFKLETFILNKEDYPTAGTNEKTWGELMPSYFIDNNSARFIRLIVRDHIDNNNLYDSHLGMENFPREQGANFVPEFGASDKNNRIVGDESYLITHTNVPIDFNEWFFIVASYNPLTDDSDVSVAGYSTNTDYWTGNLNSQGYVASSGFGSKCKVEIISKSQLLRARGYKV